MGKDRQEKKLKASGRVESDRDQSIHYDGATSLEQNGKFKSVNHNTKSPKLTPFWAFLIQLSTHIVIGSMNASLSQPVMSLTFYDKRSPLQIRNRTGAKHSHNHF